MKDWLEREDLKFVAQLSNFSEKLPAYSSTFGLTPAQISSIQADSDFTGFIILNMQNADKYRQGWTGLKDQVRYNRPVGQPLSPFPPAVDTAAAPPAVPPGVEERFREIVRVIKAHPNYTPAIGEALGIHKPDTTFNPSEGKPEFKVSMDSGHPVLKWKKGQYDGVEIWVNRGNGYERAERDLRPPFADKHPLPPLGQTARWSYKMIYILNDETVGQWSDEATVSVVGEV